MLDILATSLEALPEFINSKELVKIGLFPSEDALYSARVRGESPSYIKLKRKILYPKTCVLAFIQHRLKDGAIRNKE